VGCHYCRGRMKKGAIPYHVDRRGYHLSFDDVPAWVCAQCGQAYVEEREAEEIEKVIRTLDELAPKVVASA